MSADSVRFAVGQKVVHPELGEGVVVGSEPTGFLRVFFQTVGEKQVPPEQLGGATTWTQRVVDGLQPATPDAIEKLWMAIEAAELPLMESAATLTAAKVDLLPHQVVLVHRVAKAQPRRFLVADEVGLGKTIETAMILRELASRGELERALMVVPAGLVENWRRELNDVFNMDFEVFGSEGDVTDRRSNAFMRHNRLIASIDTLKRPARIRRLKEAPPWDLVVFDEAHHCSAYKRGNKIDRTNNFRLAEALRDHCRDLLLLSATPHQGDHFRFWMLVHLLNPGLFRDEKDMVDNRHRLNAVVVRRTKADACDSDGNPLFARRVVHTEGFSLGPAEKQFYEALQDYLRDGYNAAEMQGNQGRALGFLMTIFQKIAASSFAAVRRTLRKRRLMLTILEAIQRDEALDVDGRDQLYQEALELIAVLHGMPDDVVGKATAEQILADLKVQVLRKKQEKEALELAGATDGGEIVAASGEEAAATIVSVALPEERARIRKLLEQFPEGMETKTGVLLNALRQLWGLNPDEKIVIFVTYLGTVELIKSAIDREFPDKGVEVLKGGDHGAKTAAQRRFKRKDGPRVMICTAAGREGINLQFARVLFNVDLPWNPMDLEQRIGRIHRYGQQDTAQVYNLVAADTIEGKIFLMLEEKLQGIAETLGKVDDDGMVAEDFRSQVLGQLGSQLSYDKLYQEALRDRSLKRTQQEIDVAMSNANLARDVVFELFQNLDQFNLGDYKRFDDQGRGMRRLTEFCQRAAKLDGGQFQPTDPDIYELRMPGKYPELFTTDRDKALEAENLNLLGLEHPAVQNWLQKWASLDAGNRAVACASDGSIAGVLSIWHVAINTPGGQVVQRVIPIGLDWEGQRSPQLEARSEHLLELGAGARTAATDGDRMKELLSNAAPKILHRELNHSGLLPEGASYSCRVIGCIIGTP